MTTDPKAHRLPLDVRPLRYDIHLEADPAETAFRGAVRILLDVSLATDRIELHARDLDVADAAVETNEGTFPLGVTVHPDRETLVLAADRHLPRGPATLSITYTGQVGRAMAGLYLSEDGDERCLATQCEATDARRIVPCFDEPVFKAAFAWKVTTAAGHTVLTNTPAADRTVGNDGRVTWTFEPTRPMSSYLIACAIGPFAATAALDAGDVPFRVWGLAGKERLGVHARDFAARLMRWYEDYFGVPYHWGKYDQIAVPSFSFGAMENPGLVVFRPSLLLLDAKTASWRDEKSVDLVVAHEFAHMWFGNLVTMKWWDDLWLNEAFAEWICHKAVDELEPRHEVWNEFAHRTNRALETDALDATHAIYHPVKTPQEAGELFDAITYGKGSATLRMLEAFLGAPAFRAGLRTYMKEFAEGNAAGSDLWRHLGEASDQPVATIMESWITQPGHPVVSVSLQGEDERAVTLGLRQARARSAPGHAPTDQLWHVPLVARWADDAGVHTVRHLLTSRDDQLRLETRGALRWLHANQDDVGFYRTRLDDALHGRLVPHYGDLRPGERRGLLRDEWALVKAGDRHVAPFLGLLDRAVPVEDHYTVTEEIVGTLREIERLLETAGDDDATDALRAWVRSAFGPHFAALGVAAAPQEHPGEALRRAAVLRAVAGIGGDGAAVDALRALAERERADPETVDANLAGVAVAVSAMHGDVAHWERHVEAYEARRAAKAPPQQVERYLYTLAAFRDLALVERTVHLIADGRLAKQAVGPLLRGMLSEPHAQRAAWAHLRTSWETLREELGDAWIFILVEAAGELPPAMADEVVSFFDHALGGTVAQQSFGRAKERLAERQRFMADVVPKIATWVKAR